VTAEENRYYGATGQLIPVTEKNLRTLMKRIRAQEDDEEFVREQMQKHVDQMQEAEATDRDIKDELDSMNRQLRAVGIPIPQ
jgi:hypothetical protein